MPLPYEDTLSAIKGKVNTDKRPPFSFWKHFPQIDRKVESMVKAHIKFQEHFKPDLIKISPHGRYCVVDWGCEVPYDQVDSITGSTRVTKFVIEKIEDWETIVEINPLDSIEYSNQILAAKKIAKHFQNRIPIMMTVFLPFMVADKLVKDKLLYQHLEEEYQFVKERLDIITDVTIEYAKACLDEGVDGLFLATQHAQKNLWVNGEDDWKRYAFPFDNRFLSSIKSKSEFTILHIHGKNLFFDTIVNHLPTTAVNWHTSDRKPSIANCSFKGGLLGGLHESKLNKLDSDATVIQKHLQETLDNAKNNIDRLIIAPGCVLPLDLENNKLEIIKKVIETLTYN